MDNAPKPSDVVNTSEGTLDLLHGFNSPTARQALKLIEKGGRVLGPLGAILESIESGVVVALHYVFDFKSRSFSSERGHRSDAAK
jgi:hypothetical protein